jgi:hypothetical protein
LRKRQSRRQSFGNQNRPGRPQPHTSETSLPDEGQRVNAGGQDATPTVRGQTG